MARPAVLTVKVVADATDATRAFDQTTDAMKDTTRAARDVSGAVDSAGGATQKTAGGLRDMMGALEGTRFAAFGATVAQTSTYFEAAAGASDLFAASSTYASGVTKAWTVVQGAFNAVMSLNPVALVVIAIVALVAIIIVAYKNSETFRKVVDAAFRAVLTVVKSVYNWIKSNWPLLLAILTGPIGLAILAITRNFDSIKAVIQRVVDLLTDVLVGAFDTLKDLAGDALRLMMTPIRAVRDGIGWIIDKVEWLLDLIPDIHFPSVPSWVPGIGGRMVAPAVAGTRTALPAARTAGLRAGGGGGGITVNVMVPATANPVETGRQIVNMVRRFERAAGPGWRT